MRQSAKMGFFRGFDGVGLTAVGAGGQVWKSYDRGISWVDATNYGTAPLNYIVSNPVGLTVAADGYMYVASASPLRAASASNANPIARSLDGLTWEHAGYFQNVRATSDGGPTLGIQAVSGGLFIYMRAIGSTYGYLLWWVPYGASYATTNSQYEIFAQPFTAPGANNNSRVQSDTTSNGAGTNTVVRYAGYGGTLNTSTVVSGTSVSFTPPLYDPINSTWITVRNSDGTMWRGSGGMSPAGYSTGFTNMNTTSSSYSWGPSTTVIGPQATNFGIFSGGSTATNRFYTVDLGGTNQTGWKSVNLGTAYNDAPHALCGTPTGTLIYRQSTTRSTFESWFTEDRAVTNQSRNMPANLPWVGVVWAP